MKFGTGFLCPEKKIWLASAAFSQSWPNDGQTSRAGVNEFLHMRAYLLTGSGDISTYRQLLFTVFMKIGAGKARTKSLFNA